MKEHIRILNQGQDYIEDNLDKYPNISKFHFHRIFKTMTSQTIAQYINRIKMERLGRLFFIEKERTPLQGHLRSLSEFLPIIVF